MFYRMRMLREEADKGGGGSGASNQDKPDPGAEIKAELVKKDAALKEANERLAKIDAESKAKKAELEAKSVADLDSARKAIAEKEERLAKIEAELQEYSKREVERAEGLVKAMPKDLGETLAGYKDKLDAKVWIEMVEKFSSQSKGSDKAPPGGTPGGKKTGKAGFSALAQEMLDGILAGDPERRDKIMNTLKRAQREDDSGRVREILHIPMQDMLREMPKGGIKWRARESK